MKSTKAYEHEFSRHGVTPAQFLAYLRSMQKKYPEMASDFNLDMFAAESWNIDYCNALPSEKPCESERATDKPYEKQTYIRHHDGTTYNEIIEFQFDDEKTGYGYYYTVQIDVAEEDRGANTAENVAAIVRRRAEQADRQEAKAEKIEAEAEQADREGYTAKWWIEARRTEAARLRREAAETRAAINAAQQPQEATQDAQEAPAAEAEQPIDDATLSAIAAIIAEADRMSGAYFFQPPQTAGARRSYERYHSHDTVTWTESGHTYTAAFIVSCTCTNVYASGNYTRDGQKTTLTAIRNSYKRISA